jgi:COP9 signalosome complex subunit 2
MKDFKKLEELINQLKNWCKNDDGTENSKKSSQLLDVYVLDIQLFSYQGQLKKLKQVYESCMKILSGAVVLNPKTTGVIMECGGKIYMREKKWKEAHKDFFEAFTSYDEGGIIILISGNPRRIMCLKYLVLANMLMSGNVDPFEANEAKPYKNHSEIVAMKDLVKAYQMGNIDYFQTILKKNKSTIQDDPFMGEYIPALLKNIRSKVIVQIVSPYTRIQLSFIAKELDIKDEEVESLIVDLVLDNQLDAQIDQINKRVILGQKGSEGERYKAILNWTKKIDEIQNQLFNKVN